MTVVKVNQVCVNYKIAVLFHLVALLNKNNNHLILNVIRLITVDSSSGRLVK